jgi:hypothetical protein
MWNSTENPAHASFLAKYSQYQSVVDDPSGESFLKMKIAYLFGNTLYKPGKKTQSYLNRRKRLKVLRGFSPDEAIPNDDEQQPDEDGNAESKPKKKRKSKATLHSGGILLSCNCYSVTAY